MDVYVVHPVDRSEPVRVFTDEDDAEVFADLTPADQIERPYIERVPLLSHNDARYVLAEEREAWAGA